MKLQARWQEKMSFKCLQDPQDWLASEILSTFQLFLPPAIEKIVIEMTNMEGIKWYCQEWKTMNMNDLHAYMGLLILAGVYRSQGEAASSLWNAEMGRPIFRVTMSLEMFRTISAVLGQVHL